MRKRKKAKAHIPSNRIGKNRCIPFPANVGYRTAISDLEKGGTGGGNLLHLAEHFFFFQCFLCHSCGCCVYSAIAFFRFAMLFWFPISASSFSSCYWLPWASSFLPFFPLLFLLLFLRPCALSYLAFFVLTCTLWWIESFSLFSLFYCYYYFVSCCLVVSFDSFSKLWGNVGRVGRLYGFWGTWKRYRIYSRYLYYDSTILDIQRG